jgi:hypothetical protein
MTLFDLVVYLVLGAASGVIVRALSQGSKEWFVVATGAGFVGALLGVWFARVAHLPEVLAVDVGGRPLPIAWAIGGALLVGMWCIAAQVLVSSNRPAH